MEEHDLVLRLKELQKALLAPYGGIVVIVNGERLKVGEEAARLIVLRSVPTAHARDLLDGVDAGYVIYAEMLCREVAERVLTYAASAVYYDEDLFHLFILFKTLSFMEIIA
jgi:hypothetical protein